MARFPTAGEIWQFLAVVLFALFALSQIINFSAIGSDDPNAQIFREDVPYQKLAGQSFTAVLIFIVVFAVYRLQGGGRIDQKALISIIIVMVLSYLIYNKLIAPNFNLPPIEFAVYQLQAIINP